MARMRRTYSSRSSSDDDSSEDDTKRPAPKRTAKPTSKATSTNKVAKNSAFTRTGRFRFQDLPGEIRNHIYEDALSVGVAVYVSNHIDKAASQKKREEHVQKHMSFWGNEGYVDEKRLVQCKLAALVRMPKGKQVRKYKFTEMTACSLLHTNKDIYNEAWPLLYARNKLVFETPTAFYRFYERSHKALPFLEDVKFIEFPSPTVVRAPLASCSRLTQVCITSKLYRFGSRNAVTNVSTIGRYTANLLLGCWCDECRPPEVLPRNPKQKECVAATCQEMWDRLKIVSLTAHGLQVQFDGHWPQQSSQDPADKLKTSLLKQVEELLPRLAESGQDRNNYLR